MKKIIVGKTESVASIVERVIDEVSKDIVLVVPKAAKLRESARNFALLKREAAAAKKNVSVESVDERVLEFSEKAGIPSAHPLFSPEEPNRSMSDIVPASGVSSKPRIPQKKQKPLADLVPQKQFFEDRPIPESEPVPYKAHEPVPHRRIGFHLPRILRRRFAVVAIAVVVLFGGGAFIADRFFAYADVVIRFKHLPWQYEGAFTVSKTVSKVRPGDISLPGEVLTDEKNLTQLFPALGKSEVSQRAHGTITIWNAYSSEPQTLVATTRFQTSDGKIFRLDRAVVVPGAKIENGKITPASVDALVTADAAGEAYNLGATDKLTVPGFKGTPKYDGFYGSLAQGTKGGFVGERPVPTDADIAAAQKKLAEVLTASLKNGFTSSRPSGLTILDGASQITVTRMTVQKQTDDQGNFSVFGEAHLAAIGFRESDLKGLLFAFAAKNNPNTVFKEANIDYRRVTPDFAKGELKLEVSAKGTLAPSFNTDDFRAGIAGKSVTEVRKAVLALPLLEESTVSVWPRFRSTLPKDAERIRVAAD